jgi:hypothetical protein
MHGGRKGSPAFHLLAGERMVLAEEDGTAGVVRRIWMTLSDLTPRMLRSLRLDMYWDGAAAPSVSAPLGDFFGACHGTMAAFESELLASPEGRSFVASVPMPFRSGMRIEVTNEGDENLYMLFYEIAWTVGDEIGPDDLYFHAAWRAEAPTVSGRDFEILPAVRGRGRYLGAVIGVAADTASWGASWWGEGELKVWLDGDTEHPSLCGTGTEDHVGTGWELGRFSHRAQGCHLADRERMRYGFYRWHLADPVWFAREIRVTMQQIGSCGPDARARVLSDGRDVRCAGPRAGMPLAGAPGAWNLFERSDLWTSSAFFYLDRVHSGLPALACVRARLAALPAADTKETFMKSIPEEIRALGRFIPGVEKLGVDELRAIRDACDSLLAAAATRDEALRRAGAPPVTRAGDRPT